MTHERSSSIMDSIFASSDQEGHGRVLRIIQDFLASEAEKHSANEKGECLSISVATFVDREQTTPRTKISLQKSTWMSSSETRMASRILGMKD